MTTPEAPGDGATAAPDPRGERVPRWWRTTTWVLAHRTLVAFLLALVLLGIAALTGGFEKASAGAAVKSVEPGEAVEAAPLRITVLKAFHGTELKGVVYPAEGTRYLFVFVTLENPTSEYLTDLVSGPLSQGAPLRLRADSLVTYGAEPVDWEDAVPELYRVADTSPVRVVQPGLPQRTLVVWRQSADVPAPTQVTVQLRSQTQRRSSLDESVIWANPVPVAEVAVDVKPVPES